MLHFKLETAWNFFGTDDKQISIAIAILALVVSMWPSKDGELIELQKEETRLSIKEKELNIQKLKRELSDNNSPKHETLRETSRDFNQNHTVIIQKSNFYKKIESYDKVTQIGYLALDNNNKSVSEEKNIPRSDFHKFILLSNKLPVEIDNNALIEIVAPVLREGNAKWKGIYVEPNAISFEMNDSSFKEDVLAKKISFKSGYAIRCVLEIHREVNEVGEIIIKKYVVQTVLDRIENGIRTETESGKKHRRQQELNKAQTDFDF